MQSTSNSRRNGCHAYTHTLLTPPPHTTTTQKARCLKFKKKKKTPNGCSKTNAQLFGGDEGGGKGRERSDNTHKKNVRKNADNIIWQLHFLV